ITASPDGTFLLTVNENRHCQFINVPRRVVLHRITFKDTVNALQFSPDSEYIAPGFRKDVFAFASPDGTFLLTVDENRHCQFINVPRRVVLHRITFKDTVNALQFSPDSEYIAPGFRKDVFAFELVRTLADCEDMVTALDWSLDSKYLLVGSKDLTVWFFCVEKLKDGFSNKPHLYLGYRDSVVGCFFVGYDKKTNKMLREKGICMRGNGRGKEKMGLSNLLRKWQLVITTGGLILMLFCSIRGNVAA
ncbi:hypothetical protein Tsubulata_045989, partial [Turnera subulata]